MKTETRYVFDTSVIVSALLIRDSKPRQAFDIALDHGVILLSLPTLKELSDVLSRPKFDHYLLIEERERFLAALVLEAVLIEVNETIKACRDPNDDKFLELAVSGQATRIISSDKDLRELSPFRTIPITTPDEFIKHQRR
ncbi:MAG: putative toxin-antitoxin system toxin component, PIN family [Deltaproteobacteria bacterium HGW-Deltaproteobacteria-15]|jgi:putative PIN family toxin of toxin-antitoxin system|nr:MAG: putative toxin-antitoxin system toxin component, PIN family [Deltaproteobacteria bacterium HGW-Deltaproteobacteria-15]